MKIVVHQDKEQRSEVSRSTFISLCSSTKKKGTMTTHYNLRNSRAHRAAISRLAGAVLLLCREQVQAAHLTGIDAALNAAGNHEDVPSSRTAATLQREECNGSEKNGEKNPPEVAPEPEDEDPAAGNSSIGPTFYTGGREIPVDDEVDPIGETRTRGKDGEPAVNHDYPAESGSDADTKTDTKTNTNAKNHGQHQQACQATGTSGDEAAPLVVSPPGSPLPRKNGASSSSVSTMASSTDGCTTDTKGEGEGERLAAGDHQSAVEVGRAAGERAMLCSRAQTRGQGRSSPTLSWFELQLDAKEHALLDKLKLSKEDNEDELQTKNNKSKQGEVQDGIYRYGKFGCVPELRAGVPAPWISSGSDGGYEAASSCSRIPQPATVAAGARRGEARSSFARGQTSYSFPPAARTSAALLKREPSATRRDRISKRRKQQQVAQREDEAEDYVFAGEDISDQLAASAEETDDDVDVVLEEDIPYRAMTADLHDPPSSSSRSSRGDDEIEMGSGTEHRQFLRAAPHSEQEASEDQVDALATTAEDALVDEQGAAVEVEAAASPPARTERSNEDEEWSATHTSVRDQVERSAKGLLQQAFHGWRKVDRRKVHFTKVGGEEKENVEVHDYRRGTNAGDWVLTSDIFRASNDNYNFDATSMKALTPSSSGEAAGPRQPQRIYVAVRRTQGQEEVVGPHLSQVVGPQRQPSELRRQLVDGFGRLDLFDNDRKLGLGRPVLRLFGDRFMGLVDLLQQRQKHSGRSGGRKRSTSTTKRRTPTWEWECKWEEAVSAFYSDWRGILPRLPSSSASSSASVDPPFIPVRVPLGNLGAFQRAIQKSRLSARTPPAKMVVKRHQGHDHHQVGGNNEHESPVVPLSPTLSPVPQDDEPELPVSSDEFFSSLSEDEDPVFSLERRLRESAPGRDVNKVVTVLDEVKRRITEHVFHAVIDGPVHQAVLEGAKRFPGADPEPEDCLYVHKKNAIEEQLHPAFRTLVLEEDQDEEQEVELESESASSSLGGPPGAGRHDDEPREPAAVQHEDSAGNLHHVNLLNSTSVARVSVSGVAVSFVEERSGSGSWHSLDLLLGLDERALNADQEEAVKAVLHSLAEMVAGITKLCAHRSLEGLRLDVMGAEGEADNISGFAGAQYYVPHPLLTRLPAREAKAQEQGQAGRRSLKATTGAVGKPFYRNPCTSGQSLCGPSRSSRKSRTTSHSCAVPGGADLLSIFLSNSKPLRPRAPSSGLLMLGPLGVATGDQDSPTKCRKSGGSSRDEVLEIKADDSTEDECALRMSRSGGLKRVEDVVPDTHTEAVLDADHTAKMNHSSDDPFGAPTPTYHMPMAVRTPKPSAMEALFGDHVVDLDQVLAKGSVASAAPWFVEDTHTPLDVHTLRAQAGC